MSDGIAKLLKFLLTLIIVVYIISPLDAVPGPIDDLIIAIAGIAGNRALSRKKKAA